MKKPIYFLINSLTAGGAERVLSIIANELIKENYDIILILLEKKQFYKIDKRVKIVYLSEKTNKAFLVKFFGLLFWAYKLKKFSKQHNISLIQSHLYRANYINVLSKLFGAKHEVQIVNTSQISMYKEKGIAGKINLFFIQKLYPFADKVVCKSQGMTLDLFNIIDKKKIKNKSIIINNPYDIDLIEKLKEKEISEFQFNKNKKYVLYVGRLASFKRPEEVIESLMFLDENIELIIIGTGEKLKKLKLLSLEYNVEKRVHFLGQIANPYKFMNRVDVLVLSSLDGEGFPNVLVEAMVCKTAVIATDCYSGPREILSPESRPLFQLKDELEITKCGVLVPKQNAILMSKAIQKIVYDKKLRETFIINGFNRAKDFSLEIILDKYKKVLKL